MSIKFDKLQVWAEDVGWKLSKIQNGKYMISKHINDDEADEQEYRKNLTEVEVFIKQKMGIYK